MASEPADLEAGLPPPAAELEPPASNPEGLPNPTGWSFLPEGKRTMGPAGPQGEIADYYKERGHVV